MARYKLYDPLLASPPPPLPRTYRVRVAAHSEYITCLCGLSNSVAHALESALNSMAREKGIKDYYYVQEEDGMKCTKCGKEFGARQGVTNPDRCDACAGVERDSNGYAWYPNKDEQVFMDIHTGEITTVKRGDALR